MIELFFFLFLYQIRKKNVLKDFVAIAGPLGVTHFMIFSKTASTLNMVSSDRSISKQFLSAGELCSFSMLSLQHHPSSNP